MTLRSFSFRHAIAQQLKAIVAVPRDMGTGREETHDAGAEAPGRSGSLEFETRVADAEALWRNREEAVLLAVSVFSSSTGYCVICKADNACLRCHACHLLDVCAECLAMRHASKPPHIVERWNGAVYCRVQPSDVFLHRRCHCVCTPNVHSIMLINDEADEIEAHVQVCSCTDLFSSLLHHGYWPIQSNPNRALRPTAVQLRVLLHLESIVLSGGSSLYAACKALQSFRSPLWGHPGVNLYRKLNTFGTIQAFRRFLDAVQWNGKPECPACFTCEDPETRKAPVLIQLDGTFSLRHRATAGKTPRTVPHGTETFFIEPDWTHEPVKSADSCPNWTAGERGRELASKADRKFLDVNGMFGTICRHLSVISLSDITTPGERLNYGVTAVKAVIAAKPNVPITVSYDIACKLKAAFPNHDNQLLRFVIPTLHSYGHMWSCQLLNGIRFCSGVGLADGEGSERFWSGSIKLANQTKEMEHSRRHGFFDHRAAKVNFDVMCNITPQLLSQQKSISSTIERVKKDIADYASKNSLPQTIDAFLQITEPMITEFRTEILSETPRVRSANRMRKDTVIKLARLTAERDFLSQHSFTSRGQKMWKQVHQAKQKISKQRSKLVSRYNSKRLPTEPPLDLQDYQNFESPGFSQFRIGCLDATAGEKMVVCRLRNLYLRAVEEIDILSCEIRRVTIFFKTALHRTNFELSDAGGKQALIYLRLFGIYRLLCLHVAAFPSQASFVQETALPLFEGKYCFSIN